MKASLALIAVTVTLLATAAAAVADVHVPKGQVVDEIRVLGQDVTIDGTARGPVFVVAGNVSVGKTGEAANLTIIGGQLRTAPGARLRGDVFQLGGPWPDLNGWKLLAALLAALALHTALAWLVIGSAIRLARSPYVRPLADAFHDRPGRTITAGILASAGLLALSLVLLLTVIGIPVGLMIVGLLILALPIGVATLLELLPDLRGKRALFLVAAIPLLGDALLALAMAIGAGVLLRLLAGAKPGINARLAARY